jgi:hypothetical protein
MFRIMTRTAILVAAVACAAGAQDSRPTNATEDPAVVLASRILKEVETVRGLPLRSTPSIATHDVAEMRRRLVQNLDKDFPPEKRDALSRGYKALGLLPSDFDLAKELIELLTEQIAGYYDPEEKALRLIARDDDAASKPSLDAAVVLEDEIVMAHELVHALQDQSFDLLTLGAPDDAPNSDFDAAVLALIEGDASVAMTAWMFSNQGADPATVFGPFARMLFGAAGATASAGAMPGKSMESFAAAPAILREGLMFSYLEGALFCMAIASEKKSFAPIDAAFRAPPRSTEQILHPERYAGPKKDDPVLLSPPNLAAELGAGAARVSSDVLGELGCRILFEDELATSDESKASKSETRKRKKLAARTADGWDGDRYEVYSRKDGGDVLAWISTWDSIADAREVADRLRLIRGEGRGAWTIVVEGANVAAVGGLDSVEAGALAAKLLAETKKTDMTEAPRRAPAKERK